jgi:GntR family transcriptional regulator
MKIWLTKNSEVSIRDQLFEQVALGIASEDLTAGERLPSIRELARRFQVHPNTVSSAYRELAAKGYVEFRKGSGVYIRSSGRPVNGPSVLDSLIARLLSEARSEGFTLSEVHARLSENLEQGAGRKVVVVESDISLREIIVEELTAGSGCDVFGIGPDELQEWKGAENVVFAALYDEREKLGSILDGAERAIFLTTTSVPNALTDRRRPAPEEIIAVVSGWPTFISLARLFLIAAKIDPDSILTRQTDQPDWRRGLETAAVIISDAVSARMLGNGIEPVVFRIISNESIDQIRQAIRTRV